MSEEEMVDVEVRLDKELADKINKMTKKELVELIFINGVAHKNEVMNLDSKIDGYHAAIREINNHKEVLQTKLDKAEAYVEQGRAMILSVMERWYEYDA